MLLNSNVCSASFVCLHKPNFKKMQGQSPISPYYLQFVEHAGAGVKQSTSSSHSLPAIVRHYCQVLIVSMQAIETRLATELETRLQRCKRRDGFTRSGSPHRSPSVCCIVVLSVDYPCRRLLMVSTSQAEAANCPTHATKSPVAQKELT